MGVGSATGRGIRQISAGGGVVFGRPLQIAYKTALSESLIWSTIHIAYTSAPFTQSTLHTIHIAYRCITINIAYRPKMSPLQDRDRWNFLFALNINLKNLFLLCSLCKKTMGDRAYLSGDSMGKRLKMDWSRRLFGKSFFLKPSTQVLEPLKPLYRTRTIDAQRSSAHMQKNGKQSMGSTS